jgi:hypothetical protein
MSVNENDYKVLENGLFAIISTGEIINPKDLINANINKSKESLDNAREIAREFDIPLDAKIVRHKNVEYHVATVKPKFKFNKIFESSLQGIFDDKKLDVYSLAFLGRFTPYIVYPQNYLIVENDFPTVVKLAEILGIKRNKMEKVLKELEYYEIIKRVKKGVQNWIYFNPFLYASGGVIEITTVRLFEKSLYSTNQK